MSTKTTSPGALLRIDPDAWLSDQSKDRLWKAFMGFWILYILAPPIMLVFISLDTAPYVRVPQGITLSKYELMLQSEPLITAMERSIKLGVVTMIVAPLLGLLAALSYRKTNYKAGFVGAMILPLFVPGVVQGFSLLMLFKQIGFGQPFVSTAIGHTIWAFPFAFLVILTSMSTVREDVLLASADLGANEFETFRHVILPQIRPGLISAIIFSFVLSFNEFSRTVFLQFGQNTVPTYVFAKLQVELSPEVFALAGFTVVFSFILIGIAIAVLYRSTSNNQEH
ncbi:ABC transporter permease [Halobellus ordinarius]|uniref:ABC transporter permease n=1 Tax=Halobellus ordinarius TaxID=3075120 RepID=UPI002880B9C6|nr:ABC transporter permease subunit [Halobellus sp. ZY16]